MVIQDNESVCEQGESGAKRWRNKNGELHREDGPAIEYTNGIMEGYKEWRINGKRHNENGHAVEFTTGDKQWWGDGKRLNCTTQEEFERLMKLRPFW